MLINAARRFCPYVQVRHLKAEGTKVADLHEPSYLQDLKPRVGYYELLNLQLKGYDYTVLQKYQGYLHKTMAKKLDINVTQSWPIQHQELKVDNLEPRSSAIEKSFKLNIYERNIQMKDLLVTRLSILIELIHSTLPPGVTFSIDHHKQEDEDRRYFRDSVLENLKKELQELKDTPLIGE